MIARPLRLVLPACLALAACSASPLAGPAEPLPPIQAELDRRPAPREVPRPGYLEPVVDAVFGTTVTRISDARTFAARGAGGLRHAYAKSQPWNADGTRLMLNWDRPAPLLDGESLELVGEAHSPSEAVWMHTDPRFSVGVAGNSLVRWNMATDRRSALLHRFDEYRRITLGNGEGNLSNDDRHAALFGLRSGATDVLVYDLERDEVIGRRTFANADVGDDDRATFNNATMSQSGERVIVEFNRRGRGQREGIQSYDRAIGDRVALSANGGSHFDACVDSAGRDTIVATADRGTALVSVDATDGARTTVLPAGALSAAIHVSCRNVDRPGWAYVSSYFDPAAPRRRAGDEVFAVRLDGSGAVQRFAHQHASASRTYRRQPLAVPSPDGTRVLWASDWDRRRARVYAYVAEQR